MNRRFDPHEFQLNINRRTFLGQAAYGLGGLALACLIDPKPLRAADSAAVDANAHWKGIVNSPQGPFNSLSKLSLTSVHQAG